MKEEFNSSTTKTSFSQFIVYKTQTDATSYQPPYRGIYAIIIQNNSNQTTRINQRVIHPGPEWGILQFSGILVIIGIVVSILPRIPYPKSLIKHAK